MTTLCHTSHHHQRLGHEPPPGGIIGTWWPKPSHDAPRTSRGCQHSLLSMSERQKRGANMSTAIPVRQSVTPTQSATAGRTPSTAQSQMSATLTYTPPYAA